MARQAFLQALDETKVAAKELADPRPWTRRYPLPAVGVAAALGFMLAPTGHRRAAERDGRADHHRNGRPGSRLRGWLRDVDELLGGGVVVALARRFLQRQGRALLEAMMQYAVPPDPPTAQPEAESQAAESEAAVPAGHTS